MARARNIKPGIMVNDELAEVAPLGRLLFIYLWMLADREGRLEDRPRRIKAEALPYDDCDIDALLNDLSAQGFVYRYETQGVSVIQIANFNKHQNPHQRETESELPEMPAPDKAQPRHNLGTAKANKENIEEKRKESPEEKEKTGSEKEKTDQNEGEKEKKGKNSDAFGCDQETKERGAHKGKETCKSTSCDQSQPRHDLGTAKAMPSRADSGSLIPDSGSLIPDTPNHGQGPNARGVNHAFEKFWSVYPRKTSKQAAQKAWKKINPDDQLFEEIMLAVESQSTWPQWIKDGGQFIPHPSTWLNNKRWEDEPPANTASRHTGFDNRDYTDGLIDKGDGTYGF